MSSINRLSWRKEGAAEEGEKIINRSKKETPHLFKGQRLENKSLYRFVNCNLHEIFRDIS